MTYLTSLDIPVVRAAGFQAGFSGHSWHGQDKDGTPWQAVVDDVGTMKFVTPGQASRQLTRAEFSELFEQKNV